MKTGSQRMRRGPGLLLVLAALLSATTFALAETALEKARALEAEQKYEEARLAYDAALRGVPIADTAAADWIRFAELHFNLGRNTPDFEATLAILHSVVETFPADSLDVLRARVKLGEVYERLGEETGKREALRAAEQAYQSVAEDEARLTSAQGGSEAEQTRRRELVRFCKRRLEVQKLQAELPAQMLANEALFHARLGVQSEPEDAPTAPAACPGDLPPGKACATQGARGSTPPRALSTNDTVSANARARRDAAVRMGLLAAIAAGAVALTIVMPKVFPRVRPSYGQEHSADNSNLKSKGGHA